MLHVNNHVVIPDSELRFTFSRSGGPGGQNVNKVNSKATLHWNLTRSASLSEDVRGRLADAFANRVTNDGNLVVTSQKYRDQPKNVADCLEKLANMIRTALRRQKPRHATKPTRGSRERRLQAKRHKSMKKGLRGSRGGES